MHENIFNKILEENFSNLEKEMPIQVQEAYRTPNTQDHKSNSLQPNRIHFFFKKKRQNKERVLKSARGKVKSFIKSEPSE